MNKAEDIELKECKDKIKSLELDRAYLYNSVTITITVLVSGFIMGVLSAVMVLTTLWR